MKLYPRKINSIEELNAEKLLLQAQLNQVDPDGFFSLKPSSKANPTTTTTEKKDTGNLLGSLLGIDTIDIVLKMLPIITGRNKKGTAPVNKGPNLLVKAGVEFIGGYLKWKAIELSYKGLKKLMNKPKKNA